MHEYDSVLLFIHPPLSVLGYLFILISLYIVLAGKKKGADHYLTYTVLAWAFTLAGLITGMIWAQIAWGRYWGWDPKETATLLLFSALSIHLFWHFRGLEIEGGRDDEGTDTHLPDLLFSAVEVILVFIVLVSPVLVTSLH